MFTGIVEETGRVRAIDLAGRADAVLTIEGATVTSDARPGDSIAVDGVCLTVTSLTGDGAFTADVMPETLRRTTLGDLRPGERVNLERALAAAGRFGGHIVQGHVDGVATLLSRSPGHRWDELRFDLPTRIARYVAEKGSIALGGVSLTVAGVDDGEFVVCLIPTTLAATTLGGLVSGDRVNVEVDVLAKYVERLLGTSRGADADRRAEVLR